MKCVKCGKNSGSWELCKKCYNEQQELHNKFISSFIGIHINHIKLGKGQILSIEYNQYQKILYSTVRINNKTEFTIVLEDFTIIENFKVLEIKEKLEKSEKILKLICPICGKSSAFSYGNPVTNNLCEEHWAMELNGYLKYDENKNNFLFDNEEYLNTNYFRIVVYNKEKNESAIIDSLGIYESIWEFRNSAEANGYIVLNLATARYFNDGNIPKIKKEKFVEVRAIKIGIPQYISETSKNDHSTLIKIEDKYFVAGYHAENKTDLLELLTNTITLPHKKCLLCNSNTNSEEHLLCPSCYHLYKNKKLFLEISVNDSNIKLLDATYEGRLECDDGHIVKSQAERDIDNYLFEKNIKHGYETVLPIYDGDKRIELRPDFCIFDGEEKIYIEYWGIEDDPDYQKRKEYKMPLYKKAGITLINMYKKTDMRNIRAALEDKLKHYKKGQINFEE